MARAGTYPGRDVQSLAAGDVLPDPLTQFAQEHLRQREVCAMLDTLAAAPQPDRAMAREALRHLSTALPGHMRDEGRILFPLLRQSSAPDDEINDTLRRLDSDHAQSTQALGAVTAALGRIADTGGALTGEEAAAVSGFAAHKRRHLVVENAIVLPLARVRLTAEDLEALRNAMLRRREAEEDGEG